MRYLDDILIIAGVVLLGIFIHLQYGMPYTVAFAGVCALAAGIAVAFAGRAKGGPA